MREIFNPNGITPEELIETRDLGSRWAGSSKVLTKDCPDCRFHLVTAIEETCEWGVVSKVLSETGRKRSRCVVLQEEKSPREKIILERREWRVQSRLHGIYLPGDYHRE